MSDLERIDGLYVGQLNDDELRMFERAVKDGKAERSYKGAGALLGIAKVHLLAYQYGGQR